MTGIESPISDRAEDNTNKLVDALLKNSVHFGKDEFGRPGDKWTHYKIELDDSDPELRELCVNALAPLAVELVGAKCPDHILTLPGMVDGIVDGVKGAFAVAGLGQDFMRYRSDAEMDAAGVPRITNPYQRDDSVVALTACVEGQRQKNGLLQRCRRANLRLNGFAVLIDTGLFKVEAANKYRAPSVLGMVGALPLMRVLDRAREQGLIDDELHELCSKWPKFA